ncbi:MAG: hypothetical protein FJ095_05545 [Deltaproteobacteria bacterium]|nr:hypothetical protein [Deltaproteobacteria bacterium]
MPAAEAATSERRLESILRALPRKELLALAERMAIEVDPKKRLDEVAQIARGLVKLPDVRDPARLPAPSAALLRRIAESGGTLVVGAVPVGLDVLVRRGVVFARVADEELADEYRERHGAPQGGHVFELVLPTAFLVQMKASDGEDPRSLRALLAEAPFETASAIATHYLGRPSTPPIALSLEQAWEVLGDSKSIAAELERVSHQERRLLEHLEEVGGEVDTEELMDLEREPMRLRGSYGVAAGRRGAAFALEKRGFLFPIHPNRYVLPSEITALVGAERRRERERRRDAVRGKVGEDDLLPRRARFSRDPGPFLLALALAVREASLAGDVKPGVGTPRSLVSKLAQRFGRSFEETAMLVALSRALGLWESGALSPVAPPGTLRLRELSRALFDAWRRGGAWDEARPEAELLRLAADARDVSPVGVLREVILDALVDLGEGQWAAVPELVAYVGDDPRMGGLRRLFERWARRASVEVPEEGALVRRILLDSLPALGAVDVGATDAATGHGDDSALRLSAFGREAVAGATLSRADETTSFDDERRVKVGGGVRLSELLELATFVELRGIDPGLDLELSAASVSRGLALGLGAAEMRRRLEGLAPLSEPVRRMLEEAGTVVGQGTFTPSAGFVWIEDVEVREMLRTRAGVADLFLDPSPPGGLLVVPGVDGERLARRCRALGVELELEEPVLRARRSTIPPPRGSEPGRRSTSWRPPPLPAPQGRTSED